MRQVRAHHHQRLAIDQGKEGGAEPVDIRTADHHRDQLEGFEKSLQKRQDHFQGMLAVVVRRQGNEDLRFFQKIGGVQLDLPERALKRPNGWNGGAKEINRIIAGLW